MAVELKTEVRSSRGKRNARRQRSAGTIPAVLYGHGQETIALALPAEELVAAVRHGHRLVSLTGAVTEQAFIRELQWDVWGTHVLHVDFTRVSAHEKVRVQVPVELRGEAPGIRQGGVVKQSIHEVPIECEVTALLDKLQVSVNHLKLGDPSRSPSELPATVKIPWIRKCWWWSAWNRSRKSRKRRSPGKGRRARGDWSEEGRRGRRRIGSRPVPGCVGSAVHEADRGLAIPDVVRGRANVGFVVLAEGRGGWLSRPKSRFRVPEGVAARRSCCWVR